MMPTKLDPDNCLCGTKLVYSDCCGRFLNGNSIPKTAEALMRSRFCAYVLGNNDYLMATWDESKRPKNLDFAKQTTQWSKLLIVSSKNGSERDSTGIVEFKAFYLQNDKEFYMHEISHFVKKNNNWFYLDGLIKSLATELKSSLGRNTTCHCGSGKKFKFCCGR